MSQKHMQTMQRKAEMRAKIAAQNENLPVKLFSEGGLLAMVMERHGLTRKDADTILRSFGG